MNYIERTTRNLVSHKNSAYSSAKQSPLHEQFIRMLAHQQDVINPNARTLSKWLQRINNKIVLSSSPPWTAKAYADNHQLSKKFSASGSASFSGKTVSSLSGNAVVPRPPPRRTLDTGPSKVETKFWSLRKMPKKKRHSHVPWLSYSSITQIMQYNIHTDSIAVAYSTVVLEWVLKIKKVFRTVSSQNRNFDF